MANEHNQLIGFKVYDAQRSIYKSLETALAPLGITPGQFNLLNQLDRAGELSQKALAERTRKEQATITRYRDLLERKGLVVRTRDKNDRRAHAVSITDEARALLKAAEPITFDRAKRLVEGVDQEDLDTFVAVLAKLKENAESISGK
ncbi:MAG: MarR family transcriptional regulator [Paraeggerthella sp.]|nr:MarR family transcriptional regulator [Paraeggerthella sp.]